MFQWWIYITFSFVLFLFPSQVFSQSACDAVAHHMDGLAYLDQLRSESHLFVWRRAHYAGCKIKQTTLPMIGEEDFSPKKLWPSSWQLVDQQPSHWIVLQQPFFCRISLQRGE